MHKSTTHMLYPSLLASSQMGRIRMMQIGGLEWMGNPYFSFIFKIFLNQTVNGSHSSF